MKKFILSNVAIIFILTIIVWSPVSVMAQGNPLFDLKHENYRKAANNIAAQVVKKLPDDIHMRLLAIAPIKGDDGALVDMLTSKIKSETQYRLIERKDLDKILKEQGIQISSFADPRRPIEPGKIKGVEGLLMGEIVKKQSSFLSCNLEVFFKMDNVESGDVVFADSFKAQVSSSVAWYAIGGILVLILCIAYANRLKKKKKEKAIQFVQKDSAALQRLQDELKKGRDNLNRAHDEMASKDNMNLSSAIRDTREQVNSLLFKIEQEPGHYPDAIGRTVKKDLKAHSKSMEGIVKDIFKESENILKASRSDNERAVQSSVESLNADIKNAMNRFHNRNAGRA